MAEQVRLYRPSIPQLIESNWKLSPPGNYPYKSELRIIKNMSRREKIAGLVELLNRHDQNTLVHTFEVTFLATVLAIRQFSEYDMSLIRKIFEGCLVHDIGKTGV